MDMLSGRKFYATHESKSLSSPISNIPPPPPQPHLHSSHTSFPIIAVAIIGILATAFLLVGYYVFVIKCCLNWHRIDLLRRFSFSRRRRIDESPAARSPAAAVNRGLNEAAIRSIPVFKFKKSRKREDDTYGVIFKKTCECAVCLNEFQEEEKLRIIPNCGHIFHIDCIDIWLQNNANCPLCRTSISSTRPDFSSTVFDDRIIAPHQDRNDDDDDEDNSFFTGRDEDYVVIEIGQEELRAPVLSAIPERRTNSDELPTINISPSPRKIGTRKNSKRIWSMGDEWIDNRKKDEQFVVQPMRRSFSMDSAADTQLYLAVQEIIKGQMQMINNEVLNPNEVCSSSRNSKRSFFSFGSRSTAVQPVTLEP